MFTDQEKRDFSKDDKFDAFPLQPVKVGRYDSASSNWVGVQYTNTDGHVIAMSSIGWAAKAKALKQNAEGVWVPADETVNLGRTEKNKPINGGTNNPAIRMYNGKPVAKKYIDKTDDQLKQLADLGVDPSKE